MMEVLGQHPCGHIAVEVEAVLLLGGDEGEIPADERALLLGPLAQAAALRPGAEVILYILLAVRADHHIPGHAEALDPLDGDGGVDAVPRGQILPYQRVQPAGEQVAHFQQLGHFGVNVVDFPAADRLPGHIQAFGQLLLGQAGQLAKVLQVGSEAHGAYLLAFDGFIIPGKGLSVHQGRRADLAWRATAVRHVAIKTGLQQRIIAATRADCRF